MQGTAYIVTIAAEIPNIYHIKSGRSDDCIQVRMNVETQIIVNPVTGLLEEITLIPKQEIKNSDEDYGILLNPISGHLEKVPNLRKIEDSVETAAQTHQKITEANKSDESKGEEPKAEEPVLS